MPSASNQRNPARIFFAVVAGYLPLQIIRRMVPGGAVELDLPVQLVKSQVFQ